MSVELVKAFFFGLVRLGTLAAGVWLLDHGDKVNGLTLALAAAGASLGDKLIVDHKVKDALATTPPEIPPHG